MSIFKNRQSGTSLMEVLVAMSISLVVTASMVALMANSLGTTTRIVKMTKLADDMRVAMQMMSRDVRRSSYNANSMFCYANDSCVEDGVVADVGDIQIDLDNQCFWFLLDREHDNYEDPDATSAGGFRRVPVATVGVIEMWTGGATPDCSALPGEGGWVQITDPSDIDIFAFNVDDNLSYTVPIQTDANGVPLRSQRVRKLRMDVQGRLVMDNTIVRHVEDVISVRNDLLL